MTLSEIHPTEYFAEVHLLESQLVRFQVRPAQSRLDMVVIYAADALGAYAQFLQRGGLPADYRLSSIDFRLLRFAGVAEVHTRLAPNVPVENAPRGSSAEEWIAHERKLIAPRGRLITNARCIAADGRFECRMCFDSFGEHRWRFHQLLVDRKIAQVVRGRSFVEYRNEATGHAVDPADPFADEML